ncbi:MAG: hypothetical protein H9847_08090 [Candidatus Anaerobiospirillum pullicola]|uniref:Uncharacterized protein n=1 Tax=Candidatus Anaerobiospirillum pullicola TaxID=2838451 RepID=A0A948THM8_9GAMM|nr:hypothetical protein [Candidatus Anaerobiospirillum pullicola]
MSGNPTAATPPRPASAPQAARAPQGAPAARPALTPQQQQAIMAQRRAALIAAQQAAAAGKPLTPQQQALLAQYRQQQQRAAQQRAAQGQAAPAARPANPAAAQAAPRASAPAPAAHPSASAQAGMARQATAAIPAAAPADSVANHCHLIARTPVYDAHRVVQMYRLRFSSGNKFITDRVLPQHVGPIIDDFFLKRSIVNFVGSKAKALIMMPINPALVPLVKKGGGSRLVLQIPSYQEPSVQVVGFMSNIKRYGIRFAVDLMDVMKRGWLKGILHIEYVMINMGEQGAWQLAVFQKLKVKAPWLKIIAYGTSEATLLKMSLSYRADLVISPMSTSTMTFKQSPALLEPFQADIMALAHELFLPKINYQVFKKYLAENRAMLKLIIYHIHRFNKVDLRSLGNLSDIYRYLLDHDPIPSFTVILVHGLLTHYIKIVQSASLHVIDELYRRVLVHGYFTSYVVMRMPQATAEDRHYCFQTGVFSLLPEILLKSREELAQDRYLYAITKRINADDSLVCRTVKCLEDMESNNLEAVFEFARAYQVPSTRLWAAYEEAIIHANEFMISLQVVSGMR